MSITPGIPFNPQYTDNSGLSRSAVRGGKIEILPTYDLLVPVKLGSKNLHNYNTIHDYKPGTLIIDSSEIYYPYQTLFFSVFNYSPAPIDLSFTNKFSITGPLVLPVLNTILNTWMSAYDSNNELKYFLISTFLNDI